MPVSKNILIVIGTRPNFVKVTQFKKVATQHPNIDLKIVHTGQHYDEKMADVFFRQFALTPDFFLETTPASPNAQIAQIITRLEQLIVNTYSPDLIIVVGDVNSTLAAALTANKLGIKIAHLESGLRSCDRSMPEEINRILTDQMSDYFFITEQSGVDNIANEKLPGRTFHVGNTMIDTLVAFNAEISASPILSELGLEPKNFLLMTIHRPATVDSKKGIEKLLHLIACVTQLSQVVFPIHPRTIHRIKEFGLNGQLETLKNLTLMGPLDYFNFQKLILEAQCIITDSGGIQEESTFRKTPCLTLRSNTERPSTITLGSNELISFDAELICTKVADIRNGRWKESHIPPLWDGKATERILEIIAQL